MHIEFACRPGGRKLIVFDASNPEPGATDLVPNMLYVQIEGHPRYYEFEARLAGESDQEVEQRVTVWYRGNPVVSVSATDFIQNLGDALVLCENAHGASERREHTFARASILMSAVLLETAANCCAQQNRQDLPTERKGDKKSTLQKFVDYASTTGNVLNLSDPKVAAAEELIELRHHFVHNRLWLRANRNPPTPTYALLSISKRSAEWSRNDAVKALQVTTAFLNYFFLDVCKLTARQVYVLLSLRFILGRGQDIPYPNPIPYSGQTIDAYVNWKIDLSFLDMTPAQCTQWQANRAAGGGVTSDWY